MNICTGIYEYFMFKLWLLFQPDGCCSGYGSNNQELDSKIREDECQKIKEKNTLHIDYKETIPFVPPVDRGQVIKVYDGDTITIAAKLPYPESPLYRFQIRLLGIDSPEMKGKSEEEKEAAHEAQKALEKLILQKTVYLKDNGNEKYGRILANVYVDEPYPEKQPVKKIHLNQWMLDNGFAVPYDGKTKQSPTRFIRSSTLEKG
jgi:endonuclease YncB( thermonuclease family)